MRTKYLLVAGGLLACAVCTLPGAALADAENEKAAVICAEAAFSNAAEGRDLARFLAFVDPDARFASNSIARGRDAVAESWAGFFKPDGPSIRWRPAITEVSADGRLALSRGPYRVVGTGKDGERVESWGHFISTWRKSAEGHWLVLFDSGGDDGMTATENEIALLKADPDCS